MATREQQIIRTAVLNILANLMLSTVKFVLGSATHSIAITLDGVNSLTDSLSSALTIGGTKLAQRPASRAHPFGHGRLEY
ncbi:MAG: cation transporter, partial [Atopobiaceae bacterium]|nr:cation transporter [Atopobiaceae bacterium]